MYVAQHNWTSFLLIKMCFLFFLLFLLVFQESSGFCRENDIFKNKKQQQKKQKKKWTSF